MSWKDILKTHCGGNREKMNTGNEKADNEKQIFEKLTGNQDRIDANKDGKISGEDFQLLRDRKKVKKAESKMTPMGKKIMDEVKAEGGALNMDHLYKKFKKNFGGNKKSVERTVAYLVRNGHLLQHEDGDLYTNKPTSRGRGFTA